MNSSTAILLAVHLLATAAMTGLIWFVQLVHYPLFDRVGPEQFTAYETAHQRRTAWVVGPFMAVEGVAALLVVAFVRDDVGLLLAACGLVLLAVVHSSTVFVQVPAHRLLSGGHDEQVVGRLVRSNWIRTAGWSLRSIMAATLVVVAG
jgi:hypothetical protein